MVRQQIWKYFAGKEFKAFEDICHSSLAALNPGIFGFGTGSAMGEEQLDARLS